MASIYSRPTSPFWMLKLKINGKWVAKNTGLRVESEVETAQARILRAEAILAEKMNPSPRLNTEHCSTKERDKGWGWVDGWIALHCKTDATLTNYNCTWRHIQHWLTVNGLHHPSLIKFAHGQEFVNWRIGRTSRQRACKKNTALKDVKIFKMILTQAARLGMIQANPIGRLGISKDPAPPKQEITDEQFEVCINRLEIEPAWMKLCFHIAMHTGCRLKETSIPLENIDFKRGTITFGTPKGGATRAFTRPLPVALIPILEPLRGKKLTHEVPAHASRGFSRFFKRAGLQGITFHCLRVSYITRLHRAGVPLTAAMRLVNHSSEAVHEIYNRLGVDDVMPYRHVELFASAAAKDPSASEARQSSIRSSNRRSINRVSKVKTRSRKLS